MTASNRIFSWDFPILLLCPSINIFDNRILLHCRQIRSSLTSAQKSPQADRPEACFWSTSTPAEQANARNMMRPARVEVNPAEYLLSVSSIKLLRRGSADAHHCAGFSDPVSCRICCCIAPAWYEQADLTLLTTCVQSNIANQPPIRRPIPLAINTATAVAPEAPPALIEAGIVRKVASCRPHWLFSPGADQLNGPSRTRRLASLVTSAPHLDLPVVMAHRRSTTAHAAQRPFTSSTPIACPELTRPPARLLPPIPSLDSEWR
ncbi:hypothetical protein BDP55DRAFT_351078 [Colletotrichum godetiae]|uniref:Uncharacterized protein n=1 Tax=Colletotrichum godetiae TaxID=1209918 RepID=A0AAJ0AWU0_9PEZI|nr:uncharacterized protein BDP55DRAFT_351078 [Colletotrichum godetiae]KAK1690466.1 hypothetical protein BDP55DRAFT_351078 [Colletotrichum godetiae]